MIKYLALFLGALTAFLTADSLLGQTPPPPKREFRGVWVASVANIDYPKKPTADTSMLKQEWLSLLDTFEMQGLNAIVMQIRPAADAFYSSGLAPWSLYLTGKQGLAPQGNWDLLPFLIETAHARNFEFHAWLNPYRATNDLDTARLAPNHVFNTRRDWILRYGPKYYLNPALPEVWDHLIQVVNEIVARYDVDAIHMDDYFYPYKIAGEVFPDSADYARLGGEFGSVDDWRRHNVDTLIWMIQQNIKSIKPWVEFGISPFGVWRNQSVDPSGSPTRSGQTNYDDLYADIRKWLKEGWIDYVVPQIYFHIGFDLVDYEKTLQWWHSNSYGKKLYIGMAPYRIGTDRAAQWKEPDQMPRQMRINRRYPGVHGQVFFNARQLNRNPLGFADSLRYDFFRSPALLPERAGAANGDLLPAPLLAKAKRTRLGNRLEWTWPRNPSGLGHIVVYRFPVGIQPNTNMPGAIIKILPADQARGNAFLDAKGWKGQKYQYRVSSLDKNYRESLPSNVVESKRFPKITPSRK
ncbi:MAG: family 10 glycosylhydrolase [Haliscomenobacter sp.]|nr:family 10 glycosylhydrolase [Haliscomenobacter sp.]